MTWHPMNTWSQPIFEQFWTCVFDPGTGSSMFPWGFLRGFPHGFLQTLERSIVRLNLIGSLKELVSWHIPPPKNGGGLSKKFFSFSKQVIFRFQRLNFGGVFRKITVWTSVSRCYCMNLCESAFVSQFRSTFPFSGHCRQCVLFGRFRIVMLMDINCNGSWDTVFHFKCKT